MRPMHLVLAAADSADDLRRELDAVFGKSPRSLAPGLFGVEPDDGCADPIPPLVFARQFLPDARAVSAPSIRTWATLVVDAIVGTLPDDRPWSLHVVAFREVGATREGARAWHSQRRGKPTGATGRDAPRGRADARRTDPEPEPRPKDAVGEERCRLISQTVVELLKARRRHLARRLRSGGEPFLEDESLVQLLLVTPERGFLSITQATIPYEHRRTIACFPRGEVPIARDPGAPSRAFAKLVEGEIRLGRTIAEGETCVDLGASPGGWTHHAVGRGARVTAVDRSELRPDLMNHPRVRFQRGDVFRFEPQEPVDWLVCDVIASPDRVAELLLHWLRMGWCRNFIVTLKLWEDGSAAAIASLQRELPQVAVDVGLLRLCANKKEICAFGRRRG